MRARGRVPLAIVLSAVFTLAGCGDDDGAGPVTPPPPPPPPALQITERSPAPNAPAVETGATVTVTFNQPIDPATLTHATFRVKQGEVALPASLDYDAATLTVTVSAPFLPGSTYDVEVTTGVRTPAGAALSASAVWSFATRAWQTVTVDAGNLGHSSSLAMDGSGRMHVSYMDFNNGGLKYATCAAACATAANWQAVTVDVQGGFRTSLAVDGTGRVHVSYHGYDDDLAYATCAAACATAANWQKVIVDAAGFVGPDMSLAVDAGGRLHVSYFHDGGVGGDLKYATCAAACTTAANWQRVLVDTAGIIGTFSSLALDAGGRIHVSYQDQNNRDLKYATCAAACTTAANWQAVTVDAPGFTAEGTSLALDADGRLHVSYYGGSNALRYATCAAACASVANWQTVTADGSALVGQETSLGVDAAGRLHVSYRDQTNSDLKYATCATACATAANWRAVTVAATGDVGWNTSIAVSASGRVHVTHRDATIGALKYVE